MPFPARWSASGSSVLSIVSPLSPICSFFKGRNILSQGLSPSERCWVWWNTVLITTLVGSRRAEAGGGWGECRGGSGGGSGGGEAGEWGLEGNLSLSPRLKSSRFEPIPHTMVMPLISHLSSAVKLPEQLWSSCGYMTCALGTHLCLKHESAASPTVEFSSQTNTQNNPPYS